MAGLEENTILGITRRGADLLVAMAEVWEEFDYPNTPPESVPSLSLRLEAILGRAIKDPSGVHMDILIWVAEAEQPLTVRDIVNRVVDGRFAGPRGARLAIAKLMEAWLLTDKQWEFVTLEE